MPVGIVLDTSFLITLADSSRANHDTARRYWKELAERKLPIYLPTIVVSEFYIKQVIHPDILRACVVLPFNWDDALMAARLDFSKAPRAPGSRTIIKDDVKIIAQGIVKNAAWIITDDADTLYKFARTLVDEGQSKMHPIKLKDGFDPSFLEPNRQIKMEYRQSREHEQEGA